ncbi:RsfA family transcriptional regulator [Bacillus sp. FJAT-47783]|uniref:RsfA family transcriptional regulator n=1 Tax=Bacillus sp. FJAT-47783 TaxID=2922712 RepID=UPI001FAB8FAE|nr:RsfA family transcriptional regulator [Bacillus sp. FJAT-47783]
MTAARQDAWTQDEDLLLAEIVLRHIREGGTQLSAFEEVGKKLSRTAAACGFRWNSYVRKQYTTGIEIAKKQRKELRKKKKEIDSQEAHQEEKHIHDLSLNQVIAYLQKLGDDGKIERLRAENSELKRKVTSLEEKLTKVEKEKTALEHHMKEVEEDYRALIEIMEKARKMVVLQDEENKVKFQMDRNGNLERVEK